MVAKTKTNSHYSALTTLPQRGVLARNHQCTTAIPTIWTESSWAIPESFTANDSWIVHSSDSEGETKGLITPPQRRVSELLYACVTAQQRSRGCSQNLCSSFL